MRKIMKMAIILSLAVFGFTMFPGEQASAAYGNWFKVSAAGQDCKVVAWTDANTYTTKATTIDWKAETNGKCSKLYYKAMIRKSESDGWQTRISPTLTGYFSNSTPIKSFNIKDLKKKGSNIYLEVELYSNSAKTHYIGHATRWITVH